MEAIEQEKKTPPYKMWHPKNKHIIITTLILVVALSRSVYKSHFVTKQPLSNTTTLNENTFPKKIEIHLAGAVQRPGLYLTKSGKKLTTLIQTAGGLHPSADLDAIDLSKTISRTQKIYIPFKESVNTSKRKQQTININTATKAQLNKLPGIGESTAKKILNYRIQNGPFRHKSELLKIPGIGKKKLSSLKPYILL